MRREEGEEGEGDRLEITREEAFGFFIYPVATPRGREGREKERRGETRCRVRGSCSATGPPSLPSGPEERGKERGKKKGQAPGTTKSYSFTWEADRVSIKKGKRKRTRRAERLFSIPLGQHL